MSWKLSAGLCPGGSHGEVGCSLPCWLEHLSAQLSSSSAVTRQARFWASLWLPTDFCIEQRKCYLKKATSGTGILHTLAHGLCIFIAGYLLRGPEL